MDMTSDRRVRIDDEVVRYLLKRSRRRKKTVGIRVSEGVIEVSAPARTAIKEIEEILRKRRRWILDRLEDASQLPPPCRLITGESLPFMGRDLTLLVEQTDDRRASVTSDGEKLSILVPAEIAAEDRREQIKTAVARWYRHELEGYLQLRVAKWLSAFQRTETPKVLVRDQRSRWGSCSSDGTLRFSWRLAMLEPELIDSVVVHELAHLEVMNHSAAFWKVVIKVMPDAKERRKRLNEAGRRLPF